MFLSVLQFCGVACFVYSCYHKTTVKGVLRHVVYYSISLAILPLFLSGINIAGGFQTYLLAGIMLTILYYIIKPIVGIISFPLTIISTGLFTFLINTLILYLMTIFLPQVDVGKSVLHGFSLWGISASSIQLNRLLSYLFCSAIMTIFMGMARWLNE
jgi:putative membrane protein